MDINKLVENYFAPKNLLTKEKLWSLFDEAIEENKNSSSISLTEDEAPKSSKKSILDFLPKIQITEDWGQVGSDARGIFEKYMNRIQGDSLPDKIAWINNFMSGAGTKKLPVSEILSSLVFLELLSTVIGQFSASGAGFIFEAFLAGLLRGQQETETVAGALPIEDIRIFVDPETGTGGRALSLKLLSAETKVHGSIINLLKWLAFQDKENQGIEYVIAVKFYDKVLAFYSITITKDNILNWIGDKFEPWTINEDTDRILLDPAADLDIDEKEKAEKFEQEYNRIGIVAGKKNGKSPPRRKEAIELVRNAPPELVDKFVEYAVDAGKREDMVRFKMFPKLNPENSEDKTVDWSKAVDERRKLLAWIINNLSSQHVLGQPDVEDLDVKGKSRLSPDQVKELQLMAQNDPDRWFGTMKKMIKKGVTQFEIKPQFYRTKNLPAMMKQKRYGDITLDKNYIREVSIKYNEQLKDIVLPLYEALASFNNNLTSYYIEHNISAADEAASDAVKLQNISSNLAAEAKK